MSARSCCAVDPKLPSTRWRASSAGTARRTAVAGFYGANRQQGLEGVKEIRVGPAPILRLAARYQCREPRQNPAMRRRHEGESVHSGHDGIGPEVAVQLGPPLVQLDQAQDMLFDRADVKPGPEHRS